MRTVAGASKPTDFPRKGENRPVSFAASRFPAFPLEYAVALKKRHPEVWAKGGNIRGNEQFRILSAVLRRGGVPATAAERQALRLREAWAARHFADHRIAGVVAQIKWFVIGELGLAAMKRTVENSIR